MKIGFHSLANETTKSFAPGLPLKGGRRQLPNGVLELNHVSQSGVLLILRFFNNVLPTAILSNIAYVRNPALLSRAGPGPVSQPRCHQGLGSGLPRVERYDMFKKY